jgi:phosphoglycerol transferase MdoB-like AlkP superfamily enzyme
MLPDSSPAHAFPAHTSQDIHDSANLLKRALLQVAPSHLLWRGTVLVVVLQVAIAALTRVALLFQARHDVGWDLSLLGSFAGGLWYDLLASWYAAVPWWIIAVLVPGVVWRSKVGAWLMAFVVFLYGLVFAFIAVAEWFFWDEFQVRFNFIAVDYLIYTQEVLDNIRQSYPMPLIFGGLALAALAVVLAVSWSGLTDWVRRGDARWLPRVWHTIGFAALVVGLTYAFNQSQLPRFANEFNRELAKNGPFAFCAAFWESEIDYEKFYLKRDTDAALSRAKSLLTLKDTPPLNDDPRDLRRVIQHDAPELRRNVVLISVESLSAGFMRHFKLNFKLRSWLTPNLDRLADEGIFFTNLYATGTRTVRGLEALTLCVPPTPGQSIVWRPANENLFSTGHLAHTRGYDTTYVYGGDAMFDNMNAFFSKNGYRVIDRARKTKADITFQNAWGVCDEDLFHWAAQEADANHSAGRPFFMHVMTVSNHRPFTFPEDRIDLPQGKRDSAVKYTDYAIGRFLDEAKQKPWFANTIFVIVADHCHGNASKAELDVTKYHIPCIIWNPQLVQPRVFDALCSQIDVMPTVFGMLNWSYTTNFYGQDVFSPGYDEAARRAYVSNYQKIACITNDTLAMLKPKQEFTLGRVDLREGAFSPGADDELKQRLEDTIALYQSASWQFRNGKMKAQPSE